MQVNVYDGPKMIVYVSSKVKVIGHSSWSQHEKYNTIQYLHLYRAHSQLRGRM